MSVWPDKSCICEMGMRPGVRRNSTKMIMENKVCEVCVKCPQILFHYSLALSLLIPKETVSVALLVVLIFTAEFLVNVL